MVFHHQSSIWLNDEDVKPTTTLNISTSAHTQQDSRIFRSLGVDRKSKTPYSDATQVRYEIKSHGT